MPRSPAKPTKPCHQCGRTIEWRKKWERDWENVRYCSDACRRAAKRHDPVNDELERAILDLLNQRQRGATICPSEAAKVVRPDDWRGLMEPARQAARRLVVRGEIVITQGGRVVDPSTAKGPIRLRRA
ncbi:MAG: DUF2256 and DUF3253 domain-containing protein [Planctomycetota bacterium]